jgi:hypothetical protein
MCTGRQLLTGSHVDTVKLTLNSCSKGAGQCSPPNRERRQVRLQVAHSRCQPTAFQHRAGDFDKLATGYSRFGQLDRMLLLTSQVERILLLQLLRVDQKDCQHCGAGEHRSDGGLPAGPHSDHQQDTRPLLCAASILPRQMSSEMLQPILPAGQTRSVAYSGPTAWLLSAVLFAAQGVHVR